jgi:hypothetical protein
MLSIAKKLWQRGRALLPREGFYFDRPLLLFQSDDWGRVGLRDQRGLEQLRAAGLNLGERPYDLYSLETTEDLAALRGVLTPHRDSVGRSACIEMNFIVANLNFAPMEADDFRRIHLLPLSDGLPRGWDRFGLLQGYREGIAGGTFHPALHGSTHFCRSAVERELQNSSDRAELIRTLWRAGTPYIHWRMPWIGYEYWDPSQKEDERFLSREKQAELIGYNMGIFAKLFSTLARSACAPGYRADGNTHRSWSQYGIRVAQNGPGTYTAPHFGEGDLLHLFRTVDFEPAVNPAFSVESCVGEAEVCFQRGIPAIVAVHSINFHSAVHNFRDKTLLVLDEFLTALSSKHPDLLYLHGEDLYDLIQNGFYRTISGAMRVNVIKKKFTRAELVRPGAA